MEKEIMKHEKLTKCKRLYFKNEPWLMWLSGLSASLRTKGLPVLFPVRAHAWVAGQVPIGGAGEATTHCCFSPSFSFLSPLSKNK